MSRAERRSRTERGREAERIARRYLRAHGFTILDRNVRFGRCELDIVAKEGKELVFVEVRSRRRAARFAPEATIDRRKQLRLLHGAAAWIRRHRAGALTCRFDVIAIDRSDDRFEVRHIRGAIADEADGGGN